VKSGKIDKIELSGLIALFVGIILLAVTFYSAFMFLIENLSILATRDILQAFGEALAPLIEAVIRILYLGIMGWIGSIVTVRGVQLLKKERTETAVPKQQITTTEGSQTAQQESKPQAKEAGINTEKQNSTQVEKPQAASAPSPPAPTPTP
jgi:hypothetical protein